MTRMPALPAGDVLVQVGHGTRAHVFHSSAYSNAKRLELQDGGTVYDIALCGARGALVAAAVDAEPCASCGAALQRG